MQVKGNDRSRICREKLNSGLYHLSASELEKLLRVKAHFKIPGNNYAAIPSGNTLLGQVVTSYEDHENGLVTYYYFENVMRTLEIHSVEYPI